MAHAIAPVCKELAGAFVVATPSLVRDATCAPATLEVTSIVEQTAADETTRVLLAAGLVEKAAAQEVINTLRSAAILSQSSCWQFNTNAVFIYCWPRGIKTVFG
jgi:hypothetical protein